MADPRMRSHTSTGMSDSRGTTRRTLVQIGQDESLPEVLTRLRSHAGKTVELEIPEHSPILLTATEFRTLKDAAQRSQITLTLKTEDRLRVQLASMFDLMEGITIPRRGRDVSRGSGDLVKPAPKWNAPDDGEGDDDPISVSRRRRSGMERTRLDEQPARRRKGKTDGNGGTLDYIDEDNAKKGISAKLVGRIVAVVLVIALISGIAGWYYMPRVTISATLKEGEVSGEMTYAVGLADAQLPSNVQFRIDATETSAEVRITASVPATGGEVEPDGTAQGTVELRNPTDAPITIPAGTPLQNRLGVAFTTVAEVQVPAASGETPGQATVEIVAAAPGSGSNVAQGAFTGRFEEYEVYFSNRAAAIEGGTDRQILEVTQEDIDTLEQTLTDRLQTITADAWATQTPAGQTLVRQSVTPEEPDYAIEQGVGEVSEIVSLTGTVQATGLVYAQEDIDAQLSQQFQDVLNPSVPAGYGLLANTIQLGEAEVVSENPTAVIFRQTATATTQAIFDETARNNLLEMLAGKDYDEAKAIVEGSPEFASATMERSPSFWPERMPQTAERIELEIAPGSEQATTPTGTATPEASS